MFHCILGNWNPGKICENQQRSFQDRVRFRLFEWDRSFNELWKSPSGRIFRSEMKPKEALTSERIIVKPNPPDRNAFENYTLGLAILDYVQTSIMFSPNHLARSNLSKKFSEDSESYHNRAYAVNTVFYPHLRGGPTGMPTKGSLPTIPEQLQEKYRNTVTTAKNPQAPTLDQLLGNALAAQKYNVGNCAEMAEVGLMYAVEKEVNPEVSIQQLQGGDHYFLRIGEGKDAYICDPWANRLFPISEINHLLPANTEQEEDANGNAHKTFITNFNKDRHSLKPVATYQKSKKLHL